MTTLIPIGTKTMTRAALVVLPLALAAQAKAVAELAPDLLLTGPSGAATQGIEVQSFTSDSFVASTETIGATKAGQGVSLWGQATLTPGSASPTLGPISLVDGQITFEWGDDAIGLAGDQQLPMHYEFSIGSKVDLNISWFLTLRVGNGEEVIEGSGTGTFKGDTLVSIGGGELPLNWGANLRVAFSGNMSQLDSLTVTIPQGLTIDMNTPNAGVPEPASLGILGLGAGLLVRRRRK